MKIIINNRRSVTLEQFADKHDLTMIVNERDFEYWGKNDSERFYAAFEKCEIKDGSILISEFGNGSTVELAMEEYKSVISGKLLVLDAYKPTRKEIYVPVLA